MKKKLNKSKAFIEEEDDSEKMQKSNEILKEQEGIRNYGETGRSELLNFSFRRTGLALDV